MLGKEDPIVAVADTSSSETAKRRRAVAWAKDDPFGVEFAEIDDRRGPPHGRGRRHRHTAASVPARLPARHRPSVRDDASRCDERRRRVASRARPPPRRRRRLARVDEPGRTPRPATRWGRHSRLGACAGLRPRALARHEHDADPSPRPPSARRDRRAHDGLGLGAGAHGPRRRPALPTLTSRPGRHVVRYEAIDGSFAADITADADGVVIDYPGIARRLGHVR